MIDLPIYLSCTGYPCLLLHKTKECKRLAMIKNYSVGGEANETKKEFRFLFWKCTETKRIN